MTGDQPPRKMTHKEAVELALNDPGVRAELEETKSPLEAQREDLYAESAASILADLRAAGFNAERDVGELYRRCGIKYEAAIPILLEWLPRVRYLFLVEEIVRALSIA